MGEGNRGFWWKAALVAAAVVLPFGTVILVAVAAARARRTRRSEQVYADWRRLRDHMRATAWSSMVDGNGNGNGAHPVPVLATDGHPQTR